MYMAASGAATALYRQDVYSNNLANLSTAGFKADVPIVRQRASARDEDGLGGMPSNALLERLSAGVQLAPNGIDFTPGNPEASSSPYDVAIEGSGFFQVREKTENGDQTRLTRDGRFVRGRDGLLVTTDGFEVLDSSNSPIKIPEGPAIQIDSDGAIRQNGAVIAHLGVVDAQDRAQLRKRGNGLYEIDPQVQNSLTKATGNVRQYAVEGSSVDEIRMIMQISEASRAVDGNINLITQSDRLNDRLINQFARLG